MHMPTGQHSAIAREIERAQLFATLVNNSNDRQTLERYAEELIRVADQPTRQTHGPD